MSIDIDDYKFATASVNKKFHPFASAGDCVSYHPNYCAENNKKGNFKVDISGTNFLLPNTIPYLHHSWPTCVRRLYHEVMSPDRKQWSGYCGGRCGTCLPKVFHLLVEGC
jgi:hypothetical protein